MLQYLNEFGIKPSRGSSKSVGIDFYMPDPREWGPEQKQAFHDYLTEQRLDFILSETYGFDGTTDAYIMTLLYVSHKFAEKNSITFEDWRANYVVSGAGQKYVLTVKPGQSVCVPSGIRTLFDPNTYGEFENKSGMSSKYSWVVGAKVVDEDYTGIVHCNLINCSDHDNNIECGQKLSQLIERPANYDITCEVSREYFYEAHKNSERGSGWAGSTGK